MLKTLRELYRYRLLLEHLVVTDLKVRYRGNVLGFLWTLLNPILLTGVFWAVFSSFGQFKQEYYALFLLIGLMSWTFFSQSVTRGLNTIISNKALFRKIYVPKIVFPAAIVVSNLVNMTFFLITYLLIAVPLRGLYASTIMFPLGALMLFMLATGSTLIISSANVFFRDFTHLTEIFLRALFYMTPVFYRIDVMGPKMQTVLKMNPVYYPVTLIRESLFDGVFGDIQTWLIGFALAGIVFVLGLWVFVRTEDKFIYYA